MDFFKIYLMYFIIKNILKIVIIIYLKKKNINTKKIISIIKNKGRR